MPAVADPHVQLEQHRRELTAYCYRMLGSSFEAEDAVQETFLRAWKGLDQFEGRAGLRTWLYRIATNVCLNELRGARRRARPMDLGPARSADGPLGEPHPELPWIEPIPDGWVLPAHADPASLVEQRESVRLAFVAALQELPPRQRAVLILREVLRWHADEVANLLETSVAAVNSALQRARATLYARRGRLDAPTEPTDSAQRTLLARYVSAFESYDMDALTALLHADAVWNMPPYAIWLQTHEDVRKFCLGPGYACAGSRLVGVRANGLPAFGQYKPSAGGFEAWALQVLEISDDLVSGVTFFLDTERLFPIFGLPARLAAQRGGNAPAIP